MLRTDVSRHGRKFFDQLIFSHFGPHIEYQFWRHIIHINILLLLWSTSFLELAKFEILPSRIVNTKHWSLPTSLSNHRKCSWKAVSNISEIWIRGFFVKTCYIFVTLDFFLKLKNKIGKLTGKKNLTNFISVNESKYSMRRVLGPSIKVAIQTLERKIM